MAKRPSVTEQARRLTNGQINRRRFIMSAVASGVTLPTATALATRAEAQTPRRGGVLRLATSGHPGDGGAFDRFLNEAVGNTLLRRTSDGRITGELADVFAMSPDQRILSLTLRNGVRFQDGHLLDARSAAEALTTSGLDVTVTGEASLEITPNASTPDLAASLSLPGSILAHPIHGTTGGYRLVEQTETAAHLVKVDAYWKPGAAHFDAVELRSMPDAGHRHRAIMTGDVDFADDIDPLVVSTLKGLPTLQILETEATHHLAFPMRRDVPPLDDAEFRAALAEAIRPAELLNKIALNHGATVDHGAFRRPNVPQARDQIARLLVSEEAVPGSLPAAKLLRQHAARRGLTIDVEDVPAVEWSQKKQSAGWFVTRDLGAPPADALPGLSLNALAAHGTRLTHPKDIASHTESDAYRIADRWWLTDDA